MINLKTSEEIKIMRAGGRILARVIKMAAAAAQPGIKLQELDEMVKRLIKKAGARPAFLGYKPAGASHCFPASICTSVNEVVVHGLPTERKLKEYDVLTIDFGVLYKDFYTDAALTIEMGQVTNEARKLIEVTRKSLILAVNQCRIGKTLGDIGYVIESYARKNGYQPVEGLTGHGIGRELHEEPSVLNRGRKGKGLRLQEGMVLAVEPMLSAGSVEIIQLPDGSFATKDGSLSAHFEHTVAVTRNGPKILTM